MLDVSSLYCGRSHEGDPLRYGVSDEKSPHPRATHGGRRKPVVVFNITRNCNLKCVHCYSGSDRRNFPGQLSTPTILAVLEDLADFGVPAVLLSGGEPLVHPDFFTILERADGLGLRTTLSTNGTRIDRTVARRLKRSNLRYVGISLDGMRETNDRFRGLEGAFDRAVRGIENCQATGQKVGLRLTLTRHNHRQLDAVFDFVLDRGIDRICFYHLAYSGRGGKIRDADLDRRQRRTALRTIFRRTRTAHEQGEEIEVLCVANPVDNAFLYKLIEAEDPDRARSVRRKLEWNGGALNGSGTGIAAIDFYGRVHPNQFWMNRGLGNVKDRPFSEIWQDPAGGFLSRLRDRRARLPKTCQECHYTDLCGGGLRLRAEAEGDVWGMDPCCYLTGEERRGGPIESHSNPPETV